MINSRKLRGGAARAGGSGQADCGTQTESTLYSTAAMCISRSTQTNPRTRSIFTKSSRFTPVVSTSTPDHLPDESNNMLSSVTLSGDRAALAKNRFRGKRRSKVQRLGPRRPLDFLPRTRFDQDEPVMNIESLAAALEAQLGMNNLQAKLTARKTPRSAPAKLEAPAAATVATSANPPKASTKVTTSATKVNASVPKAEFGFNPLRRLELGRNPLAIKDPIVTMNDPEFNTRPKPLAALKSAKSANVDNAIRKKVLDVGPAMLLNKAPPKLCPAFKIATKKSSLLLTFLQESSSSSSAHVKEVKNAQSNPPTNRLVVTSASKNGLGKKHT